MREEGALNDQTECPSFHYRPCANAETKATTAVVVSAVSQLNLDASRRKRRLRDGHDMAATPKKERERRRKEGALIY